MNPPTLAHALLLAVAGDDHAELVAGDLHEEFLCLSRTRGRRAGNRWYVWQVVRSLPALWGLRMRSGEVIHIVSAMLAVVTPLLLLDRLWCFVYSQIRLKDGLHRAPFFLAVNLLLACACTATVGPTARTGRRAAAMAAGAAAASGFALWNSVGATPVIYVCLVLLTVPTGALIAWRKSR